MPEVTPFDSVASLLEDLIQIAQQQLRVTQEVLQNIQAANTTLDALLVTAKEANRLSRQTLDVEKKSLHVSQQTLRVARESLAVELATLESSHRIEVLLGGTGPAKPKTMEVKYQFTLEGEKTE